MNPSEDIRWSEEYLSRADKEGSMDMLDMDVGGGEAEDEVGAIV